MIFGADYSNQAVKFLKKTDKVLSGRLLNKIEQLRKEPIMTDTKKLHGIKNMFRIRVGNYRILYDIDFDNKTIGIVKIDKRDDVY